MDQSIVGLAYVQNLSYLGIFIAVALSGYVIPVPEELILILGGFLAASGFSNVFILIAVCVAGAFAGDNLIYYLSGHGSRFTKKYHKRVEETHAGWYMRHMKRNTFWTVFWSRFIVGLRFLNPLVSGLLRVRWRKFASATLLSAAIYIPIVIGIGYIFHNEIYEVLRVVQSIRHFIITLLALGTVVLGFLFITNLLEKKG